MNRRDFLHLGASALASPLAPAAQQGRRPNIVLIYGDDVGYGDLSCYGATRVKTPNLDRLAAQGVRFTDVHTSAATCTPSRYSLLTGEYSFRKKDARVLPGDAPALIEPGRPTLPSVLKQAGYRTGVVGKWHLGLGRGSVDWNTDIAPGPLDIGFDYSFLMPATGDRVPCVYVENRRVVNLDPTDPIKVSFTGPIGNEPTGKANPELLRVHPSHGHDMAIVNGVSRIGYMTGGKKALWKDEDMAADFARQGVKFIAENKSNPFFLYFATHGIHVPRLPNKRFTGRTPMGPRGDAIAELDWTAGEILQALERHGLTRNTIVMFSSDNGPVIDDGYRDQAVEKLGSHRASGPWRGGKYSNFEAGTRVPFMLRWPERVKPGVSGALLSQVDLLHSFASLTGQSLPETAGPDSQNMLPALLGDSKRGRDHLVEQSRALALRQGKWKYIEPNPGPAVNQNTNTELGTAASPQLYDVSVDPGERNNVAAAHPERVRDMAAMLQRIRSSSGTRGVQGAA